MKKDLFRVWNLAVANVTILPLAYYAPTLLLICIDSIQMTRRITTEGASEYVERKVIGLPTIIGQAASNTLLYAGFAILGSQNQKRKVLSDLSKPQIVKSRKQYWLSIGANILTLAWLLIAIKIISPDKIELWEAVATLVAIIAPFISSTYLIDRYSQKLENSDTGKNNDPLDESVVVKLAPNNNKISNDTSQIQEAKIDKGINTPLKQL